MSRKRPAQTSGKRSSVDSAGRGARPSGTSGLGGGRRVLVAGVMAGVGLVALVVHWPALASDCRSFDDTQYLVQNRLVQNPSWTSTWRFLSEVLEPSTVRGYYQPLAMISLMIDCGLGGQVEALRPFHRTSLALHVCNVALVVLLLYLLFGHLWAAGLVGLLFAVHPLTVEPIPWVSERKTLLATLFALGALIAYVGYVRRPSWGRYGAVAGLFVLALLAKPTVTMLPVLLLLLDYWPLRRLSGRAVWEKLPLLAIAAVSAVITYVSQSRTAVTALPTEYGPGRIPLTICHNIVFYLHKLVWPVNLTAHYPPPQPLALSQPAVLAGVVGTAVLAVVLLLSLRWTRGALVGWLFFFVAIFPTLGIIGFTHVIASDKYAYFPMIGLAAALTALLAWLWERGGTRIVRRRWRVGIVLGLLVVLGAASARTRDQLTHWRDTERHVRHMLDLAPAAPTLHNMYGVHLLREQRPAEAIPYFEAALRLDPGFVDAAYNRARALVALGRTEEALAQYRAVIAQRPDHYQSLTNLGLLLREAGQVEAAEALYRQATEADPTRVEAWINLGKVRAMTGRADEALAAYRAAIRVDPFNAALRGDLVLLLQQARQLVEAEECARAGVRQHPEDADLRHRLGSTLCLQGRMLEGVAELRTALRLRPNHVPAYIALGAALEALGDYAQAAEQYRAVLRLDPQNAIAQAQLNALASRPAP